jgi:hypothetical protein
MVTSGNDFDLPSLFKLAGALLQAQGIIPSHLRKEGEVVAVVLAGRELGIPPMAALRSISVVQGRVVLDAGVQLGLMVRAGGKVRWDKDGSDGEAVLVLERPGMQPFTSKYTMEDAKRAKLTGKDNWQKFPAAMLRARAVSAAGKAYFADVLAGVYVPGELEDEEHQQPQQQAAPPREAQVVHSRTLPAPGGVPAPAQLPASTEGIVPLADELVEDLYETTTRSDLDVLLARAQANWASFKKDEKLAIKAAREHATDRVTELEREAREAEEADRALRAAADTEPGSFDAPDELADHVDDALGATQHEAAP